MKITDEICLEVKLIRYLQLLIKCQYLPTVPSTKTPNLDGSVNELAIKVPNLLPSKAFAFI